MSHASSVDIILSQAEGREKQYDWLGTVELCNKALDLLSETDFPKKGLIQERIGSALYRAAMQAESQEEFRERMCLAVANYEKAKEFYGRLSEPRKTPRILRCDSMIAFVGYWLAPEMSQKKMLLNDCWRIAKEALKAFDEAEDALEKAKTYTQLSMSAVFPGSITWDSPTGEKILKEVVEYGEKTLSLLSTLGDSYELAKAYVEVATYLELCGFYFMESDEKKRSFKKAGNYWSQALGLSEETAMVELLSTLGFASIDWGDGTDRSLRDFGKALEYGLKTKDHFLIGTALDCIAYHTHWRAIATEDPDEKRELFRRDLQYVEDAKHHYSIVSFTGPIRGGLWVEAPHAHHYYTLMRYVETDLTKRRELLEKALEAAPHMLKRAENSGYPEAIAHANHNFSLILYYLSISETKPDEKKILLKKALEYRIVGKQLVDRYAPYDYWDRGVYLGSLALLKFELSDLTEDNETKKKLLQEAVTDMETAGELCVKGMAFLEDEAAVALFAALGSAQYTFGNWLNRLYEFTNDKDDLRKAVKVFDVAVESFQKPGLTSRIAECYWKIAEVYDRLREHLKAAENFDLASGNYKSATEKLPQLKDLYQEHALYMQAWSEIEKARHHHSRQEYSSAEEHFEKAANLHKTQKQWSYLASNYSAWARVEHAEDLSRKEQCEEAMQAFKQAAQLFNETGKSIQTEFNKIEDPDERFMAMSLTKASELRREYCIARIALEEAKILDKKGDHYSSSEKYGSAVEILEKLAQASESQQDRKELELILTLSKAWQKMTQAEAEASPTLYMEASQFFEEAKEFSPSEKAKMLALGHSRFCRALEAGTRLADTRDSSLHATATQHLESAANYYMKAGFQNSSEYAKATELLLDAYMHIDNAKRENDPEKKAKLYTMAEKVLQTSAGSFMKAEHPEKREQVQKLLEKVKEERELALSLSEVLHAPSIVSTTTAFTIPTPNQEHAVGVERFEHADIQANVIAHHKELRIGDNLDLEIELVNAGKGPALLVKLAEIIPEGFDLTEKPEIYRVEDSFLNMKGKRLDPLKTEEVKLILKPKVQGAFELKPKILYLDENGKYKSHEPDPITITVKELGIKGWIKGER